MEKINFAPQQHPRPHRFYAFTAKCVFGVFLAQTHTQKGVFVIGRYNVVKLHENQTNDIVSSEHFPFLAAAHPPLLFIVMKHFSGLKILL